MSMATKSVDSILKLVFQYTSNIIYFYSLICYEKGQKNNNRWQEVSKKVRKI